MRPRRIPYMMQTGLSGGASRGWIVIEALQLCNLYNTSNTTTVHVFFMNCGHDLFLFRLVRPEAGGFHQHSLRVDRKRQNSADAQETCEMLVFRLFKSAFILWK